MSDIHSRLDELEAQQAAQFASTRNVLSDLEPVRRDVAQKRHEQAVEASGKVVAERKPKTHSRSMQGAVTALVTAVAAGVSAWQAHDMQTFALQVGTAVSLAWSIHGILRRRDLT